MAPALSFHVLGHLHQYGNQLNQLKQTSGVGGLA